MNKSARKRLCWNCEGSVSVSEETCPFCGVSVIPAFLEGAEASDFAPPYATSRDSDFGIPQSPFKFQDEEFSDVDSQVNQKEEEGQINIDEFKSTAVAVTLLLSGSVFFLFSLALALFSHHGVFTLQWDAEYWFIYTILAIPLFFFGWRSLMKLE